MESVKPSSKKFRRVVVELYQWFPQHVNSGVIEKEFGKSEGERIIQILKNDGIIEVDYNPSEDVYYYELTSKGVSLALSIVNLEHNETMKLLTYWIIALTIITLLLGLFQILFTIF